MGSSKNKSSRRYGEGTVYQRSDGRWVASVYLGKKADGKNNIKSMYAKSEPEARRKLKEFKKEMTKHDVANLAKGTVGSYMLDWLHNNKQNLLKPTSSDRLETTLTYQVIPAIGHIQLAAIQSADIQNMVNDLYYNQRKSLSTVKKAYDAVNDCFRTGVIQHTVSLNPAVGVAMPSKRDERLNVSIQSPCGKMGESKLFVKMPNPLLTR